jgi:GT2 family glycosyltransferase
LGQISIVVVNWNGKRFLNECLDSIREQVYRPSAVILVDNGSNDGSVSFVAKNYPEVQIIALPENSGFSKANNIALGAVGTQYVALLNNDAVAHPFWLKSLVDALETHPEAGFAASKMLFYDKPGIIDRAGDAYTAAATGLLRGRGLTSDNYNEPEWIFGACAGAALYRAEMLEDIGLFDDDFFLIYEDVDLSFRAQLRGFKCLYVPEAIVYHKASSSVVHDSPISVYYSHRNLEWVYIKNMPATLIPRTIFPHVIYNIGSFCFFTATGRMRAFVKAKLDALKDLQKVLEKRRQIQENRKVNNDYIWNLLDRERFLPRLMMRYRLSKGPNN